MPGSFRFAVVAALMALVFVCGARVARTQATSDEFFAAIDHPSIGYRSVTASDRVAALARRLAAGEQTLAYDNETGYLPALLAALDIPISSQLAVFSRTSLQGALVSPRNPRALYFNDSVVVAWPRGGFIEIASHDPRQGAIFYMLSQERGAPPIPIRRNECLGCHHSYATGGVPGLLKRSVITGPRGEAMPYLGNYLTDDRSPFEERWAGWFVTGATGSGRHLGNQQAPVTRDVDTEITPHASNVRLLPEALQGYPSQQSDLAAHLVFDHQARVMNLLTRVGWQVRLAEAERGDVITVVTRGAMQLVDALLFVDEARLPDGLAAGPDFTAAFAARGPRDAAGRSLRELDLRTRLMRYPCSYMIYSEAFDGLPDAARDAVYRRLSAVLTGADAEPRYARLTAADRTAIVEILRATKKGLPDDFGQRTR